MCQRLQASLRAQSTFDTDVLKMGIIASDYLHVTGRVHLRVLCHVLRLDAHTAVMLVGIL